ncbi:MAG TPA: hypothetical protein VMA83_04850 [Solirubrobacteraceae bacterium]|nr:hypothetical protein [Solirubrobacteraceae bacterium]
MRLSRLAVSPRSLSGSGGRIKVSARTFRAKKCRLSVKPAVAGLPKTVSCRHSTVTFRVTLPADPSRHAASYAFTLVASAGRRSSRLRFSTRVDAGSAVWPHAGVLNNPINFAYMKETHFGTKSYWIQPWRSYLETQPASDLTNALGVNLNVTAPLTNGVSQLLEESGFKLVRIGINWRAMSYENPDEFVKEHEKEIRVRLEALREHHLRPLIILDANSLEPAPSKPVTLTTEEAAPAGAETVKLTPESAKEVVDRKTGFDKLSFGGDPDILITKVQKTAEGEIATLSAKLPAELPAGEHKGTTLRFAPFTAPEIKGKPNPEFEETLQGWLAYVRAVCHLATSAVGPGEFDVEIWNELSFGSQFLNSEAYYKGKAPETTLEEEAEEEAGEKLEEVLNISEEAEESSEHVAEEAEEKEETPEPEEPAEGVGPAVRKALLDATVAMIRNPEEGFSPGIGISNGFASQTPFPTPTNAPVGLTAYSKHPYNSFKEFPGFSEEHHHVLESVNALGEGENERKSKVPSYVPHFYSLFPEYFLTAIATENLVRDVSPVPVKIYKAEHGRTVAPPGGSPIQTWITEYGLQIGKKGYPVGPSGEAKFNGVTLAKRDHEHFLAKAELRSLVANTGVGIEREYFYAAAEAGELGMISEPFMVAIKKASKEKSNAYPGAEAGGEVMRSFRNLTSHFQGPGPGAALRHLTLPVIEQENEHAQFKAEDTPAHPPLYDREVLAVFPYQSSPTRFVIPVYVMTRDLLTLYQPEQPSTDIQRFDLPPEAFRITLGDLPSGVPKVKFYDPMTNTYAPAKYVEQTAAGDVFEVFATDYPRLLELEYPG